jgi:hypothetical protein
MPPARGRIGGRRPTLSDQPQAEIRKMITNGNKTAADAARLFKVHPATRQCLCFATVSIGPDSGRSQLLRLAPSSRSYKSLLKSRDLTRLLLKHIWRLFKLLG